MVVERENLYDERGLPKKPLLLHKLPFLMMERAINFMKTGEKVRLAALSDNMERCIKSTKMDMEAIYIMKLGETTASVSIDQGKVEVAVTDNFPAGNMEGDRISKREIEKWCDNKKEPTENVTIVLKRLQDLLSPSTQAPYVGLELNVAERRISEILKTPVFRDVNQLVVSNFRMENKTIDTIIEFAESKNLLLLGSLVFPNDYYHAKALKCNNVYYNHASWVNIGQLLTLRDRSNVYLHDSALESSDLNILLKFWVTVDYDMFRECEIQTRMENYDRDLLRGVGVLEAVGMEEVEAMFPKGDHALKKQKPGKKCQLGAIQLTNGTFHMKTTPTETFKQYIDILNLVNLRNEKEVAIQNLDTEWEEDERVEPMRRLTAEKNQLEQRLITMNVQIQDDMARIVRNRPVVVEEVQ